MVLLRNSSLGCRPSASVATVQAQGLTAMAHTYPCRCTYRPFSSHLARPNFRKLLLVPKGHKPALSQKQEERSSRFAGLAETQRSAAFPAGKKQAKVQLPACVITVDVENVASSLEAIGAAITAGATAVLLKADNSTGMSSVFACMGDVSWSNEPVAKPVRITGWSRLAGWHACNSLEQLWHFWHILHQGAYGSDVQLWCIFQTVVRWMHCSFTIKVKYQLAIPIPTFLSYWLCCITFSHNPWESLLPISVLPCNTRVEMLTKQITTLQGVAVCISAHLLCFYSDLILRLTCWVRSFNIRIADWLQEDKNKAVLAWGRSRACIHQLILDKERGVCIRGSHTVWRRSEAEGTDTWTRIAPDTEPYRYSRCHWRRRSCSDCRWCDFFPRQMWNATAH